MDRLKNRLLFGNMIAMLVLAWSLTAGPGQAAPGGQPLQAALPSSFTFDLRPRIPDGVYDLRLRLFNDIAGGSLIGNPNTVLIEDRQVAYQQVRVTLDFGPAALQGGQRSMEVGYRPASSTGAFTILPNRAVLHPVPYAISLRPGAVVSGTLGVDQAAISGMTSSPDAIGLRGRADLGYGVYASSAQGIAVVGFSDSGNGLYGLSQSGYGVYAQSTKDAGLRAFSTDQSAVLGTSFKQHGIQGESRVEGKAGVYGVNNTNTTGSGGVGVLGESTTGIGVQAKNTSGIGVHAVSENGVAVQGQSTSGTGVFGTTQGGAPGVAGNSNTGPGVRGTSNQYGVSGQSSGVGGLGVFGTANAGSESAGVYGRSTNGVGVWGYNPGGFAMRSQGHAKQSVSAGGWVKAMAYIEGTKVVRCFNSQVPAAEAAVAPCGINVQFTTADVRQVDFGFPMASRFATVEALGDPTVRIDSDDDEFKISAGITGFDGTAAYVVAVDQQIVCTSTFCGTNVPVPFMIIVY